jgi:hypothetical protein
MLSKVPLNWNYVLSDYWADIWELKINEEYLLTTNNDDGDDVMMMMVMTAQISSLETFQAVQIQTTTAYRRILPTLDPHV